ncbi:replication protein [Nostoc punctiforme PCC 73102]|uniref:Replication protein n=1 Tax=Nostoc punctiforme (strain ATCC 29133 / PCC 73102) TaxID=63737 RepID=B2ITF2_NOSP7|nr:replication protein [Nostoc punctiforme PCC 73102]
MTLLANDCSSDELLRTTLDLMNESLRRLVKLKIFPGIGWIKFVEVTQRCGGNIRPCFHILMIVKASYFGHGYLSQKKWAEVWQRSLRVDYSPTVSVKRLNPEQDLLIGLISESAKYCSNEAVILQLSQRVPNVKTVTIGGILRNYSDLLTPINITPASIFPSDSCAGGIPS